MFPIYLLEEEHLSSECVAKLAESLSMAYTMRTASTQVTDKRGDKQCRLVGYWLNSGSTEASVGPGEAKSRLEDLCGRRGGHHLELTECESGVSQNPMRIGLWNALRKLVCHKCQPKRMSFGIMNLEDFITQAMGRCSCRNPEGLDGIVVANVRHISSDAMKNSQLILLLAERGKHLITEDGMCVSCCCPNTKAMLEKRKVLIPRAS